MLQSRVKTHHTDCNRPASGACTSGTAAGGTSTAAAFPAAGSGKACSAAVAGIAGGSHQRGAAAAGHRPRPEARHRWTACSTAVPGRPTLAGPTAAAAASVADLFSSRRRILSSTT